MALMMSRLMLVLLLTVTANIVSGQNDLPGCSERYVDSNRGFGTRLMKAVEADDYECMRAFLKAGDDPNRNDRFGNRAVSFAAIGGSRPAMLLLQEYGAELDSLFGDSPPLVQAACHGGYKVVEILVDAGVSRAKQSRDGKTAADSVCDCATEGHCSDYIIRTNLEKPNTAVSFNTDLPSGDGILNDGSQDLTATNKECWELCEKKQGCKAWTRIKRTQENGSRNGECWLRSYKPQPKPCNYCDSGVTSCSVISNVDYPSDSGVLNYGKNDLTSNNEECCALCTATPGCKVWTRIKSSTQYNKEGECWLRNFVPEQKGSETSDSGLMS